MDNTTTIYDYRDPINFIAAVLIFLNGIFGVLCNSTILYIFFKEKSEQTSFNLICSFRAFFDIYTLAGTFLLVFLPITILGYSPYSLRFETWNISLVNTFYLGNDYLCVVVAINRLICLFFPFKYPVICRIGYTLVVILFVYGHRFVVLLFQVDGDIEIGCFTYYKLYDLAWSYTAEFQCFQEDGTTLYYVVGTTCIAFGLNLLTFTKIVKIYMSVAQIDSASRKKVKKNILLFFQTVLQDSLFVVDIVFTFNLSTLSENRFWKFLSGTLIWQSLHSLDGFVMMMFNEKLSQLRSGGSGKGGFGAISHPASVVVSHFRVVER